eukprot:scaffold171735_cov18-Prasinocladus_malaysianus.AAC.1
MSSATTSLTSINHQQLEVENHTVSCCQDVVLCFDLNNFLARYRPVDMECINDSLNEWRPEGKGCDWETDATICT